MIGAASLMKKHGVYSSGAHATFMAVISWESLSSEKRQEYMRLFKLWGTEELAKGELGERYTAEVVG